MHFDIVHLHQKLSYPYSYGNEDLVHYNFWVTNDSMELIGNIK